MTMNRVSVWLGCVLMVVLGVASGTAEHKKQQKSSTPMSSLQGDWGGPHIRMNITGTGATLELNCETATISEPIKANENGEFEAKAAISSDGPGPTKVSESDSRPITIKGKVEGDKLHVEVRFDDQHEPETYDLIRGAKSRLTKCS
jgi:hypothetical protein